MTDTDVIDLPTRIAAKSRGDEKPREASPEIRPPPVKPQSFAVDPAAEAHKPGGIREQLHYLFG